MAKVMRNQTMRIMNNMNRLVVLKNGTIVFMKTGTFSPCQISFFRVMGKFSDSAEAINIVLFVKLDR